MSFFPSKFHHWSSIISSDPGDFPPFPVAVATTCDRHLHGKWSSVADLFITGQKITLGYRGSRLYSPHRNFTTLLSWESMGTSPMLLAMQGGFIWKKKDTGHGGHLPNIQPILNSSMYAHFATHLIFGTKESDFFWSVNDACHIPTKFIWSVCARLWNRP